MKKNMLGNTGIEVSELSFGTLTIGKNQGNLTAEAGGLVVKKALELGINFFDTGRTYGTEGHLREGLRGAGGKAIIATKTRARTRDLAQGDFEASLKDLDRSYIDIYHLHLVQGAQDLVDRRGVLDLLLEFKENGLIKAIGASVHKVEGARAVVAEPDIDVLFPVLNSHGLGIIDGSIDDMLQVCSQAQTRGMGIYAMKPLAGGHLRKSPEEPFHYLRNLGFVDSICVGMKSPAEAEMNVSIFEGREVSKETLSHIETVSRTLKILDRCVGCGACVEACVQEALHVDHSQTDESKGKKGHSVVDGDKCILCGYCAEACPEFVIRVI
jgi:aryl-alcohol dehydrogenase-like predicted oxidoreductase/NAD-dependent dihydropyrimidine dehydrogenase PreA subunit